MPEYTDGSVDMDQSIAGLANSDMAIEVVISLLVMLLALSAASAALWTRWEGFSTAWKNRKKSGGIPNLVQCWSFSATFFSWLFSFCAIVVAIRSFASLPVCIVAAWICCCLYAFAKVMMYLVMVEKVRMGGLTLGKGCKFDRAPLKGFKMRDDKLYILNWGLVGNYNLILVLMLIWHYSTIKSDGTCYIGLNLPSSLPLFAYDIFFTIIMTYEFWRSLRDTSSDKLKAIAQRNFRCSVYSMISSEANLFTFFIFHESGMPVHRCVGFCSLDILLNVLILGTMMKGDNKRDKKKMGVTSTVAPTR